MRSVPLHTAGLPPFLLAAILLVSPALWAQGGLDCDVDPPWCQVGQSLDCSLLAEQPPNTSCAETRTDVWTFNEGDYCKGCPYTFYILVECGTEMHLPLNDMEGADVRITEVLTGAVQDIQAHNTCFEDPSLTLGRCVGPSGFDIRCRPWSDQGTNVSWGFPDCRNLETYTCADGPDPDLSPGEAQLIDVSIQGDPGLCGIYRLDILSGGFQWDLFANCDGTDQGRFPIFSTCAEALDAFNPLPELAVSNITLLGDCPDYIVGFDLDNLGCSQLPASPWRLTTGCGEVFTGDAGPLAANSTTHVEFPLTLDCVPPVSVTVDVDPNDDHVECSESGTVAACRIITGAESLTVEGCNCQVEITADAGPDAVACGAGEAILDAGNSTLVGCPGSGVAEYQWRDEQGRIVRRWSQDATYPASFDPASCPGERAYLVEVRCSTEPCVRTDTVLARCALAPDAPEAESSPACDGTPADLTCLNEDPASTYVWDFTDDGVFDNTGCVQSHTYPGPGEYTARLRRISPEGCFAETTVTVTVLPDVPPVEALSVRLARSGTAGLEFAWQGTTDAADFRISRSPLGTWYDHRVEEGSGVGVCSTGGSLSHNDPDDLNEAGSFYYLVAPLNGCGTLGGWGFDSYGLDRPAAGGICP